MSQFTDQPTASIFEHECGHDVPSSRDDQLKNLLAGIANVAQELKQVLPEHVAKRITQLEQTLATNGTLSTEEAHEASVIGGYLWDYSLPIAFPLLWVCEKCQQERRKFNLPPLPTQANTHVATLADLLRSGKTDLPSELADATPAEISAAAVRAWWLSGNKEEMASIESHARKMLEGKRAQAIQQA